jgi:hypothetical protein
MALLEAHLRQPESYATIQQEKKARRAIPRPKRPGTS